MTLFRRTTLAVLLFAIFVALLPELLYPRDTKIHNFWLDTIFNERTKKDEDGYSPVKRWNVVITGANVGLGLATAKFMAQIPHCTIFMACRSMAKCESAKHSILAAPVTDHAMKEGLHGNTTEIVCLPLDLASRVSTLEFASLLSQKLSTKSSSVGRTGKEDISKETAGLEEVVPIHFLINNAGFFGTSKVTTFSEDVEAHVRVNHLGHFHLTHLLWRHLLAGNARVVSVSSLASILPVDAISYWSQSEYEDASTGSGIGRFLPAWLKIIFSYSRSKRANLMMAAELHHRFSSSNSNLSTGGVCSVASHPGYSRTSLVQRGLQFVPRTFRDILFWFHVGSMAPEAGAMTQIRAALDQEGILSGDLVGPKYWTAGTAVKVGNLIAGMTTHHLPFTRAESRKLWDQSMASLDIKEFGEA